MKPATKVFATLSMAAAVGAKISIIGETQDIRGAGTALEGSGYEAAGKYPYPGLSEKKIEVICDSVKRMLPIPIEPQEILSILMAGLVDIYAKCNPARHELLDPVFYAAQACLDFYPDDVDHEKAFGRYETWCQS